MLDCVEPEFQGMTWKPMLENRKLQRMRAFFPIAAFMAGAACTTWVPAEWFQIILSCSLLAVVILAVIAMVDLKNERRPPVPMILILEALWLPSRNGEIKMGPALLAFLSVAGWVVGMLLCAATLPIFA